jgi:hypothetical protein
MDRIEKALASVDLTGRGLEIGPSYNPLVTKASGARIETVDHDDHVALQAQYATWGIPQEKLDCIEPVDHIWQQGSLLDVVPTVTEVLGLPPPPDLLPKLDPELDGASVVQPHPGRALPLEARAPWVYYGFSPLVGVRRDAITQQAATTR